MSRIAPAPITAPLAALALVCSLLVLAPPAARASAGCVASTVPETGYTPLWDGVSAPTSSGWTQSGPGSFEVVNDGAEGCRLLSKGGLGLLWYSARTFTDYQLRMQWRAEKDTDNSGVFVRFPSGGGNTHNIAISQGYEVQIREGVRGDGEDQKTGSIYNVQRELARNAKPNGQWNDYEIKVETPQGPAGPLPPRITVTLNGLVVNVFQATSTTRGLGGYLGLQNHGAADTISYRNIRIRNLTDTLAPVTSAKVSTSAAQLPSGWYEGGVDVSFDAADEPGGSGLARTEYRIDNGAWQTYGRPEEVIYDGTEASFAKWKQAPSGSFARLPDGTLHSVGGLGMLWYPVQEYGDVALRFDWRDARPSATGSSNSGVFMRFPNIDEAVTRAPADRWPCQVGSAQTNPAWVAINCGHEIQIYDGSTGEVQKTGSIYNFKPLTLAQAKPNTQGDWNSYEIRTVGGGDYTVTVIRNGEVINVWQNTPGQKSSRPSDPDTDVRQFAKGYLGLQNHGFGDHIQIRNVRVQRLDPPDPVRITAPGAHTIEYRSIDSAGNVEATKALRVDIDPAAPVTTATVDQPGGSGPATITLQPTDVGAGVTRTEYRVDGGDWQTYVGPEKSLLDHTAASFAKWKQVGPGAFIRQADGSILSSGGLGMLYYPAEEFGDAVLRFEFRDTRTDGGSSNSGVFMRFPHPEEAVSRAPADRHACQTGSATSQPAWVAIYCGHEFQIYDGSTGEVQKTGSVYNFAPLDLNAAKPTPPGEWSTYEVKTVGGGSYTATISRNGQVLNTFVNAPGKSSSRSSDPSTSARQFASGYIGLQNHGTNDKIQIRNVRVQDLRPEAAAFTVSEPGTHTIEFRSYDGAGRVEAVQTITVTV